jgi:hypothetical protein
MNAKELKIEGDSGQVTSSGVWFCGQCRTVWGDRYTAGHDSVQAAAEACCKPPVCACGAEVARGHVKCDECWRKGIAEKRDKTMAAAEKVETWDSWVYDPTDAGPQDGYFESLDALVEWYEDNPEATPPEFVHLTIRKEFSLDFSDCIEAALEESYEDARDGLVGEEEITAAVAEWVKRQNIPTYEPDYKRAIRVPTPSGAAPKGLEGCHADRDGDCTWKDCPQLRDKEPSATGRHCPLDVEDTEGGA